jgi:DNA helicase-2/ATP-dependent DNA helicase PcrA
MPIWKEGDLNDEQIAAIEEDDSVFLVACPGSGKTRTLTYKIAHELSKLESTKKWVVAITYTHRAADEIQNRIERLGIDTSQLWIGTIHSFCLEWILKPYALYHDALKNGFRVINSFDSEKQIIELCKLQRNPSVTIWDCKYHFTTTERVLSGKAHLRPYVNTIIDQYYDNLRANKQVDFELILKYAYELITQNPSVGKILSSLFTHILIDEYQDTKEIQYAIVSAILREGGGRVKAFVVGDPNQSIYESLGGYAIIANDFSALAQINFIEMELSLNYRSSSRIIEYFSHFNAYNTKIDPAGELINFPSVITFDALVNQDDLLTPLTRIITHSIEEEGISPNEICILAPQWAYLASMTRSLVGALPEYSFDGPGMVPFTRDIDNFWYKLSRIILTEPSPSMYIRRLRWAKEIILALNDANVHIGSLTNKSLLRECNSIDLTEQDGLTYLEQFFNKLFDNINIDFRSIPSLVEHHTDFFSSSQDRIERLQEKEATFISDITSFRKVFENRSGITVSTIHGIKGEEYDVVIAYALLEGMVPFFGETEQSAKKTLYVVGSRARKHLHLISERGRMYGRGHGRTEYPPTAILNQCNFNYND